MLLDWKNTGRSGRDRNFVGSPESALWKNIKKTTLEDTDGGLVPKFDSSVVALNGKRIELQGVGFLLKSGVRDTDRGEKEILEFMLLPGHGGVAWCCGLTAIPDIRYSVLVECPDTPFPIAKVDPSNSSVFVNVAGTLRLQKPNSIESLYTLEEASIEFVGIEDVLPPNVMNQCLNQPMLQ